MTSDDLKARLKGMGSEEKEQFKFNLGHGRESDDVFVLAFVASPEFQARVCYRLGVQSQADKVAEATFGAFKYAKLAFWVGLAAVVLSLVALFK